MFAWEINSFQRSLKGRRFPPFFSREIHVSIFPNFWRRGGNWRPRIPFREQCQKIPSSTRLFIKGRKSCEKNNISERHDFPDVQYIEQKSFGNPGKAFTVSIMWEKGKFEGQWVHFFLLLSWKQKRLFLTFCSYCSPLFSADVHTHGDFPEKNGKKGHFLFYSSKWVSNFRVLKIWDIEALSFGTFV